MSTLHGFDVEIDRLAALAAFGRSALKLGSGSVSVLPSYRKRLKMLSISPWGPMAMGINE